MKALFTENGWADYRFWQDTDRGTLKRVNRLIEECLRTPSEGIGKPEALKHQLAGYGSRRVTDEHRLVCTVEDGHLVIIAARHHY